MDYSCAPYNSYSELIKAEPWENLKDEVLARKRQQSQYSNALDKSDAKNAATKICPAIAVVLATTIGVGLLRSSVLADTKRLSQLEPTQVEEKASLLELVSLEGAEVEKKSLQQQVDEFIFYGQMREFDRQEEARKLREEAAKARQEERKKFENFFSTMQEMTIEGQLSVKLDKISNNLTKLAALTENPAEAKPLEKKIASQIKKLQKGIDEYEGHFEGLRLSLKSEQKCLKKCIKLRKEYEEALRQARIQAQRELESLKSFYASFTCYSYVTPNMGISKERFREIMASIPYGSSTVFRNNADFMWELAKKGNFNEILLPGICAWESGWGDDAVESNNFSSQRKQDGSYFSYDTQEKGILALASNLADNYLPEDGIYYNGKCLDGINVLYCYPDPNHEWAKGVSACMKMVIREYLATIE